MKVYYLQAEYETGKHKILKTWAEFFGLETPNEAKIREPYSVLEFDEYYNRKLARLLFYNDRGEEGLPDRFYIDNDNKLRTQEGELIAINPNPQKEAYKLSQLYGLTHEELDTYIDNNVTNLAEAKEFIRKLAHVTLWLVKQTKLDE